jgi:hypothetical protein
MKTATFQKAQKRGFGRLFAWIDRKTQKPYKGYNSWRSRKWNMKHQTWQ